MATRDWQGSDHPNWIAVLSYTASLAVSVAIWGVVIRGVQYLVRIAR
jgi:hypothetical protein